MASSGVSLIDPAATTAHARAKVTSDRTKAAKAGIAGHLPCLPDQDHQRGWLG